MSETLTDFVENYKEENFKQAEVVKSAVDKTANIFGSAIKNTIVSDLSKYGANVAGIFHDKNEKREGDIHFLKQANQSDIIDMFSHEHLHYISKKRGKGNYYKKYKNLGLSEIEIEEAVNTKATQKKTGIVSKAYKEYQSKVFSIFSRIGITENEATNLHINDKTKLIEKLDEADLKIAA